MILLSDKTQHRIGEPFTPDIEVIAHSLAYQNRYTGHFGTYSVAQHCVLVSARMPKELELAGLLHDAPEAYLGDVSSPLKAMLPDYQRLERFYHDIVDTYYGVSTMHPAVGEVDRRMLVTEAKMFGLPLELFPDAEPYRIRDAQYGWNAEKAKDAFLKQFHRLVARR